MSDLPEGWTRVPLDSVAEINPRHSKNIKPSTRVTFLPMPAISESSYDFDRSRERPIDEVRTGYTHFAEGDVLFAKITPCMENGKGAVATGLKNGLGCGTTELHVVRPRAGIDPYYIYHFLHQDKIRQDAAANFTGSAGQLRVPVAFVAGLEIPIPPLPEQRRIVTKLEEVLAKVTACQQRLAHVPTLLKRFRQSILSAACSGRLTADWREENENSTPTLGATSDQLPSNWRECEMRELVRVTSGEAFKKSEYSDSGARLLQIANVSFGRIIWEQQNFLPASYLKSHDDLVLSAGDILMALNRPLLDWRIKVARISQADLPAILYQRVGRFHFNEAIDINRDYFFLFLQSSEFIQELSERLRGTDQPYVNPPEMLEILFPLPPLAEQKEIVRRVEQIFALADAIEARLAKATAQTDRLTQAVLAKAFRGELVPTQAELSRSS